MRYPSRIEGNAKTDFYFKVRFDTDFGSVVPGLLIKTLEGIFLYGTNSFVSSEGRERIIASAGDVQVYKFTLPLTLNEGITYFVWYFGWRSFAGTDPARPTL